MELELLPANRAGNVCDNDDVLVGVDKKKVWLEVPEVCRSVNFLLAIGRVETCFAVEWY